MFRQLFIASAILLAAPHAGAACLPYVDSRIQAFDQMVSGDPANAARAINEAIAHTQEGSPADARTLAGLYAVLAQAQSSLEHDVQARAAASHGIVLLPQKGGRLYINLLGMLAGNTYDNAGVRASIDEVSTALDGTAAESPEQACLLVVRGHLHHQIDQSDQAIMDLTRAYRMSVGPDRAVQRAHAADALSYTMRDLGDYQQALDLNEEVIEHDQERKAWFDLGVSRYLRGDILRAMGDHSAAIRQYEESRRLSETMDDPQGVAFTNMRMCESRNALGERDTARDLCDRALAAFTKAQSADARKETLTELARIDLADGKPARALAQLNEVLDAQGEDLVPRRVGSIYRARAQANAALGRYREAYDDLSVSMSRYKTVIENARAKEAAALRARFETDHALERSAQLKHEVELQNEQLRRQAEGLRWTIGLAIVGAGMVTLLTYLLFANRKQKQELERMAERDSLTSLPNRRHMFQIASAALKTASENDWDVTVALVDLDHFKSINDRFGHATGDNVLQLFAKAGREALRDSDLFGRWGGEEFLIVLPRTTLDTAMVVLERLRAAALKIQGEPVIPQLKVSLSAGLATNERASTDLDDIIARADAALYEAKNSGRDVVRISEESFSLASATVRQALRAAGVNMITGSFDRYERDAKGRRT